jgi:iron complex transport system ATP-binding protein
MVFDAVLLGRKPYIKWDVGDEDKRIVSEIIERLGLSEYKARYLNELSGGELQKVVLARAMAQQPVFLLLDEPTSNLDPKNQHEMLQNVKKLAVEHRMGVAIVIHDLNLAMRYCDKFLFLKDGRVYSYGGIETVTSETIDAVYDMKSEIIKYRDIKMIIPY